MVSASATFGQELTLLQRSWEMKWWWVFGGRECGLRRSPERAEAQWLTVSTFVPLWALSETILCSGAGGPARCGMFFWTVLWIILLSWGGPGDQANQISLVAAAFSCCLVAPGGSENLQVGREVEYVKDVQQGGEEERLAGFRPGLGCSGSSVVLEGLEELFVIPGGTGHHQVHRQRWSRLGPTVRTLEFSQPGPPLTCPGDVGFRVVKQT